MRILIADDHPLYRAGVASAIREADELELLGESDDGADALALIRQLAPDVALVDIKMPGMNGYDLARTICSRYGVERPLLIAVSGHFKRGPDQMLAQIAGFDHFFPKPCDPNALLALLKSQV